MLEDSQDPSLAPLGPIDRVSFLAEQARNRLASWKLISLCVITILAMGAVLGLIVTPLLLMAGRIFFGLVDAFVDFPDAMELVGQELDNLLQRVMSPFDDDTPRSFTILALAAWIVPGVLAIIGGWLAVRALFSGAGVGGVLEALQARPPRTGDVEEMQLTNIVTEMAIAAGVPPLRVLLVDSEIANAASVGLSREQATVVVSRRILDEMDRDETQGVLAHLVGSIGNGDLGIALMIMSVFQTFGLVLTVLDLPFSAAARRTFFFMLRYAFSSGNDPQGDRNATLVSNLLLSRQQPEAMSEVTLFMQRILGEKKGSPRMIIGSLILMMFLPLILARLFAFLLLSLVTLFLLGPLIGAAWRNRRRLADSTAVQLTRNPTGLARGLIHLSEIGDLMPGAGWGDLVFIVGADAGDARRQRALAERMATLRKEGGSLQERISGGAEAVASLRSEVDDKDTQKLSFASRQGLVASFHPSINSRILRLQAMGAEVEWTARKEFPWMRACLLPMAVLVLIWMVIAIFKA